MGPRRFPPPWSVEETDACFIVRDDNGQALASISRGAGKAGGGAPAHPRRGPTHRRQHRQAAGAVERAAALSKAVAAAHSRWPRNVRLDPHSLRAAAHIHDGRAMSA
jgi:hypothetical protein